MDELPAFTYHPDPLATGMVVPSEKACQCCGEARGYLYNGNVYCEDDVEDICPWCIAGGDAAREFDASFADPDRLVRAGVDEAIVEEVTRRTPGYESWQSEVWLAHCSDACEFHGDATRDDLRAFGGAELDALLAEHEMNEEEWQLALTHYEPAGQPALYKFVCRHCALVRMHMDYT